MRIAIASILTGALLAAGANAHADTLVGSIPLPVSYSGTVQGSTERVQSSTEIAKGRIFIDWTDYVPPLTAASIRVCTSFTDWGTQSDSLTVSLATTQSNGQLSEIAQAVLGNTRFGGAIFHHKCGPKTPITDFTVCGADYSNTCRLFAWTNYYAYTVVFKAVWIEIFQN